MLHHPTFDKLAALGLSAMATGLSDQMQAPSVYAERGFEDRLGLLVDKEADARESRSLTRRLRAAKLRYPAALEDIDWQSPRGLDRSTVAGLAQSGWVAQGHNLVVTVPTGVGKSYLACALTNAALRAGHTAYYVRVPRMIEDLGVGRADGRYARLMRSMSRVSLLVLDDFLLTPAPVQDCKELCAGGQPVAGRCMACGHGGLHPCRGDPGPDPALLSSRRSQGSIFAPVAAGVAYGPRGFRSTEGG